MPVIAIVRVQKKVKGLQVASKSEDLGSARCQLRLRGGLQYAGFSTGLDLGKTRVCDCCKNHPDSRICRDKDEYAPRKINMLPSWGIGMGGGGELGELGEGVGDLSEGRKGVRRE